MEASFNTMGNTLTMSVSLDDVSPRDRAALLYTLLTQMAPTGGAEAETPYHKAAQQVLTRSLLWQDEQDGWKSQAERARLQLRQERADAATLARHKR